MQGHESNIHGEHSVRNDTKDSNRILPTCILKLGSGHYLWQGAHLTNHVNSASFAWWEWGPEALDSLNIPTRVGQV